MERDVRYIKKEDNPKEAEIQEAKALFKEQILRNNFDFSGWVFHFDRGEAIEEIYKDIARDARYIKKEDIPSGFEIQLAKFHFKMQLLHKNYNFNKWIFHFDVGEVFNEIYRDNNGEKHNTKTKEPPVFNFNENVNFSNARFEVETSFSHSKFDGDALFEFVFFSKLVDFTSAIFVKESYFNSVSFGEEAFFNFVDFHDIADFSHAKFEMEISFSYATFFWQSDFMSAKFGGQSDFMSTTFGGEAYFMDTVFRGIVSFEEMKTKEDAYLSFDQTQFIARASFDKCNVEGEKIKIQGVIDFNKASFSETVSFVGACFFELNFNNCLFEKQVVLPNEENINVKNREYYRIAKHEALRINNQILAHDYHVKEMRAYRKELDSDGITGIMVILSIIILLPIYIIEPNMFIVSMIILSPSLIVSVFLVKQPEKSIGIIKSMLSWIVDITRPIQSGIVVDKIKFILQMVGGIIHFILSLLTRIIKRIQLGIVNTIKFINLMLNQLSTYYGSNWAQGMVFVLVVSAIGYSPYSSHSQLPSFESYIDYLNDMMTFGLSQKFFVSESTVYTPDGKTILHIIKNGGTVDSIGWWNMLVRVFIGYGIYQTVAAFRRLGKFTS